MGKTNKVALFASSFIEILLVLGCYFNPIFGYRTFTFSIVMTFIVTIIIGICIKVYQKDKNSSTFKYISCIGCMICNACMMF